VLGIGTFQLPLLLFNSQRPPLPSLNEIATGTLASLVIVAQPAKVRDIIKIMGIFINLPFRTEHTVLLDESCLMVVKYAFIMAR
jgi:hypothetical protein